jgi:succinyl-diaminopimelate desuccinylase
MKNLLKNLIQADSTVEKGELAAAKVIADELKRCGISCRIDKWDKNRANLIASLKSSRRRGAVLFACHLDVVPPGQIKWKTPPFAAVEKTGKIYGRGAVDMKGPIAAIVTAVRQIADSKTKLLGDVILFAAAGEETDSCGAKKFVEGFRNKPPKLVGVVITEPTDFEVVSAHRGLLWLQISTKGKAAHGSTPHLGINAINSMRLLLNELDNYKIKFKPHELLGRCSASINTITGGNAINIVPDKCTITMDIRTLPGQNHRQIIGDLRKIFAKLKRKDLVFDAEVSIIREVVAMETDNRCDFVRGFCSAVSVDETKAVGFTTDGPYFASLGVPVVIFGPGRPELCHKPDEYIEVSDLEKAVEHYKKIILSFLA